MESTQIRDWQSLCGKLDGIVVVFLPVIFSSARKTSADREWTMVKMASRRLSCMLKKCLIL